MSTFQDITGQQFGRLTVVERMPNDRRGSALWQCRCICGQESIVYTRDLKSGAIKSCGCLKRQRIIEYNTTHGMSAHPLFRTWRGMLRRCMNPKHRHFIDYGGRGIKVCERWKEFTNFIDDMGERPSAEHSLDRIDNDRNYEPGNCRWALQIVQNNNQRASTHRKGQHRTNRLITAFGETLHLREWVRRTGIPKTTIQTRLKLGWMSEQALTR